MPMPFHQGPLCSPWKSPNFTCIHRWNVGCAMSYIGSPRKQAFKTFVRHLPQTFWILDDHTKPSFEPQRVPLGWARSSKWMKTCLLGSKLFLVCNMTNTV